MSDKAEYAAAEYEAKLVTEQLTKFFMDVMGLGPDPEPQAILKLFASYTERELVLLVMGMECMRMMAMPVMIEMGARDQADLDAADAALTAETEALVASIRATEPPA